MPTFDTVAEARAWFRERCLAITQDSIRESRWPDGMVLVGYRVRSGAQVAEAPWLTTAYEQLAAAILSSERGPSPLGIGKS